MRWPKKPLELTICRFLFWPKCLNGEYRWLEFAGIKRRRVWAGENLWCEYGWADKDEGEKK